MAPTRLIKRYANRKLYDSVQSRYVTLEDLSALLCEGIELEIVDNQTKEDLTAVTMAQILVEEEKRRPRSGPLPHLREFLQQRGELLSRRISEPVQSIRSSVGESVTRLIKSGEEMADERREQIRAWFDLEEVQRRLDERVRQAVAGLDPLARVTQQLQQIDARLRRVEAALWREGETQRAGEGIEAPDDHAP